jgi:cysteine desulfurase
MTYFDHNATTPLDPRALDAMLPYLGALYGNPSSLHRLGRVSRSAVDAARERVAALLGAAPGEIVFVSGGTEANNLAIKGLAALMPPGVAAMGATEHPSVVAPMESLRNQGWQVETLPVDGDGRLLDEKRCDALRFASVMLANNETGVIQDLASLAHRLIERGAILHCDAVQAAGKIPLNFKSLGVHLLTLSAHKLYGPKGVGALAADASIGLAPLLHGGGQEKGLRGGTENVAAIVGFGKAAELALAELEARRAHLLCLRERLEAGLDALPGAVIFARNAPRLPNTLQFALAGIDGETLVMALDRKGFAVSSGSACASGAGEPSPVLLAMGVAAQTAKGAVRVSLGKDNGEADIDAFLAALSDIAGHSAI